MSYQFDFEVKYQQLQQFYEKEELSLYEANIFDFVTVIKENPDLLTTEDRASLENLLQTLLDDVDVNEISNKISDWYENHPKLQEAIFQRSTYNNQRGAGGRKTKLTPKEFKQLIENVVRDSKPPQK